MSEPEVGQEVWVRGRVMDYDKKHKSPNYIQANGYDYAVWMRDKDLIPVSPPLDAPDEPGMWVQCFEDGTRSARDVYFYEGVLGASLGGVWRALSSFDTGTWRRISDELFGAVEKVEAERTLVDIIADEITSSGQWKQEDIRIIGKLLRLQGEAIQGMQGQIAELQAGMTKGIPYPR